MYVKEVRKGSIVADLIPSIPDLVGMMDSVLIVVGFGALLSKRIRNLIAGQFIADASKSDIRELNETIRAVAHDKDGTMRVESIRYEKGVWNTSLEIEFNTKEARTAVETLDAQKTKLDATEHVDHTRVLMTFERSSISIPAVSKPTGERVVIGDLSEKAKALIYGSNSAERINVSTNVSENDG